MRWASNDVLYLYSPRIKKILSFTASSLLSCYLYALLSSCITQQMPYRSNMDKHVLSHILPDPNNHTYNLRPRRHELTLAIKGDARNFFERHLFKDILITTISYLYFFSFFTVLCCFLFLLCCCVLTAVFYTLN